MSEEPINFQCDLGQVDTSRPCPVAGTYSCTCKEVVIKKNKDGDGHNLVVTLLLDNSAEAVPGGSVTTISPGYQLIQFYSLQSSKKPDVDKDLWKKQLARLYDGFMGTDNKTRPELRVPQSFQQLVSKRVWANIVPKDDPEYGLQPEIKKLSVYNA